MGQKSSKRRQEVVSELEKRMVAAVVARHKDPNRKVPPSFDAVALKFPVINKAFREVREVFNKFDVDKSKTIDLDEMKVRLEAVTMCATNRVNGKGLL